MCGAARAGREAPQPRRGRSLRRSRTADDDAYGLRQVGISGITPDAEPSPAHLAAVADVVRSEGVSTVYSETLVDPKTAQTLADEVGVRTDVLDPIEGIAADSTYDSVMRANLATLRQGQECR